MFGSMRDQYEWQCTEGFLKRLYRQKNLFSGNVNGLNLLGAVLFSSTFNCFTIAHGERMRSRFCQDQFDIIEVCQNLLASAFEFTHLFNKLADFFFLNTSKHETQTFSSPLLPAWLVTIVNSA